MSAAPTEPVPAHPIARFARRAHAVVDGLGAVPAWSMTAEEQRETLVDLARLQSRVSELRMRVLAAADLNDVGAATAAASTAAWLADRTTVAHNVARADVRLAKQLDGDFTETREALSDGRISEAQARVIVDAVNALPGTVDAAGRRKAELHLIAEASHRDPRALKMVGRAVFEFIDPEAADAWLAEQLAAEARAAARATFLSIHDNEDGTCNGWFRVPLLHGHMLRKYVQAITAPRRTQPGTDGTGGLSAESRTGPGGARLSPTELAGIGFCQLLERFPAKWLPKAGGVSASLVVLMDLEKLQAATGAARLDTGGLVSPGEFRRLACEAGILPVVLGGKSQVLDVGRKRRFHNEAQRIAMMIRDGGCTTEGCDRPAAWCHAHHDEVGWAEGGGTSVERGRLLRPFHHGKAHDPLYDMTRLPDGKVRFHRRT